MVGDWRSGSEICGRYVRESIGTPVAGSRGGQRAFGAGGGVRGGVGGGGAEGGRGGARGERGGVDLGRFGAVPVALGGRRIFWGSIDRGRTWAGVFQAARLV